MEKLLKIGDVQLYSKKQILEMLSEYQTEKYYSPITGKFYLAIISNNKCFAKQYPEKDLFYLVLIAP